MTVYVDDMAMSAAVTDPDTRRVYNARWCHLFSSAIDPTELHDLAQKIRLRREWFQPGHDLLDSTQHDPVHDHYDVTMNKRLLAIKAGAVPVTIEQAVTLWQAKRDLVNNLRNRTVHPLRNLITFLDSARGALHSETPTPEANRRIWADHVDFLEDAIGDAMLGPDRHKPTALF
jgi:hypothetical protein